MSRLDALRHRLTVFLRPRRYVRELEAERRFHLELEAMQQKHGGMDVEEAVFAARRRFGNVTYYGEETRRMTMLPYIDGLAQDLRYTLRTLLRSPGFALAVVAALALGIGANTAIFSVVNRLLLHPLPYKDADRIVFVGQTPPQSDRVLLLPSNVDVVRAWAAQARSFDDMEAYWDRGQLETGAGYARMVVSHLITPGLPAFLGVHPVIGRTFVTADTMSGAPPVVLISETSWRRDFGGSTSVLGRTITLDSIPHVIVGVMPAHWEALSLVGPSGAEEVWTPLSLVPGRDRRLPPLAIAIARLRLGITPEQAGRELDVIASRIPGGQITRRPRLVASVLRAQEGMHSAVFRSTLLILLGAVGLVLLIACANVANLLLARGTARAREIAVRAALGASRWRLVRHVLVESLMLSLAGGACGTLLAAWGLHVIAALRPRTLTALTSVRLDACVLWFTLALSLATGLLFSVVPALRATSPSRTRALQGSGSGVVRSESGARFRTGLVVAETALSVILLVSAGLLIRSVLFLQHRDIGFDARRLMTVRMTLPPSRYDQPASRELFARQMLDGLRAMPGVLSATQASEAPPFYAASERDLQIQGRETNDVDQRVSFSLDDVQPDYFRTVGVPLLDGHTFTNAQMQTGDVVIVNEALARRFWPSGGAIGRQLRWSSGSAWKTVVAVVGDVTANGLVNDSHFPQVYEPYREAKAFRAIGGPPGLLFIVRATADPQPVIGAIRQLSRSIDPNVAVTGVALVESQLAESIAQPRFNMALLTAFAILALVLAAVGLAAVLGYTVTERTHEIGIRMALGARETTVLHMVIVQGLRAAAIGVGLGVLGALAATRLLSGLLYGVAPRDPATFVGVAVLLLLVALAASWLPARRATRVDPIDALRAE